MKFIYYYIIILLHACSNVLLYPPAPLGATRLRSILFQTSNLTSLQCFAILQVYSLAMLCNIASLQVHPLKSSELISYNLIACILQPECFKVGCLLPGWNSIFTLTFVSFLRSWGLWKSFQIPENSNVFPICQKSKT